MASTTHDPENVFSDVHGDDTAEPASIENVINRLFSNREKRLERRLAEQLSRTVDESVGKHLEPLQGILQHAVRSSGNNGTADEMSQRLAETQRQYEQLRKQYEDARQTAERERRSRSELELMHAIDRALVHRGLRHTDVLRAYFSGQCYRDEETGNLVIRGEESDRDFGGYLDQWMARQENAVFLPPLGRGGTGTAGPTAAPPNEETYDTSHKTPGQVRQDLLDGRVPLIDPFAAGKSTR